MYIRIENLCIAIYLILNVLIISVFQLGCTVYTSRDFIPVETQQPVTMFGRYALHFLGSKYSIHDDIAILLEFLNPVPDSTLLETIPVFTIDSIRFEGSCMDTSICHQPIGGYDALQLKNPSEIFAVLPTKDLTQYDKYLHPIDYWLKHVSWFSKKCNNQNVFVTIHARLLDRATGKTIAEESKKVEYFVKKKTTLNAGS